MRALASALLLSASLWPSAAVAADSPIGTWVTEEATSKIRIAPCGASLCATILWAKDGGTDGQNPDPALRRRSVVGLALSRDIRPDGKGGWKASMYNPENGSTYRTTLNPTADRLEVSGCVLGGLLCGSETWTRTGDATGSIAPPAR